MKANMKLRNTLFAAGLALTLGTAANAGTTHFGIDNGVNTGNVDISVTVQDSNLDGYDYEFVINNNSHCEGATVTGIYFESGWVSYFGDSPFDRNLSLGGPPNFLEGEVDPNITGWVSPTVSYEVMVGNTAGRFDSGKSATVAFNAESDSITLEMLENALGTQGFGVGLRLQELLADDPEATAWALAGLGNPTQHTGCEQGGDLPDDGGDNGEPTAVPTPSAALMGLALMGLTGMRRRRSND